MLRLVLSSCDPVVIGVIVHSDTMPHLLCRHRVRQAVQHRPDCPRMAQVVGLERHSHLPQVVSYPVAKIGVLLSCHVRQHWLSQAELVDPLRMISPCLPSTRFALEYRDRLLFSL